MNNYGYMLNTKFANINNKIMNNQSKYMKINLMNMNNNYYINQPTKNKKIIPFPTKSNKHKYNFNYNKNNVINRQNNNNVNTFSKLREDLQNLKNEINKLNVMVNRSKDRNIYFNKNGNNLLEFNYDKIQRKK